MTNLPINAERLWSSLMEMAKIGATEKGGNCRLALTDLDRQGRDLFVGWCEDAGLTITVDAIGNIFARRAGRYGELPPVLMGSHLDTQPTGGRFDGVLGVLAGLEVLLTLNDHGIETAAPIEVCSWTNEEGTRYAPSMMGSGVFSGVFEVDKIRAKTDYHGAVLGDELARIGYAGDAAICGREIGAYFELHIEQGPILEAEKKTIGVVTAAQGQRWLEMTVTGQESHAGPTPMSRRRDALVCTAAIVTEVNRIGLSHSPQACATVGSMVVSPNSRNVIPGQVFLSIDFRHPDDDILAVMDDQLKTFCAALAATNGFDIAIVDLWYSPPTMFDAHCIEAVREGARAFGYAHMEIISGAGHDAVYLAGISPAGMIFIPCEDGISHNEIENASKEDCAAGCQVLLHAVLARAEQPAGGAP